MTDSTGGWRFTPSSDGTTIDYRAALDVKAPLPGFILRRVTDGLVAASLPNMFASIEREVRVRQARTAADVRTAGVEEAELARRPRAGVIDADARRARAARRRGAVVSDEEVARARQVVSVVRAGDRQRRAQLARTGRAGVARAPTTPSANPTIGAAARISTAPATPSVSVTTFMQWCMP